MLVQVDQFGGLADALEGSLFDRCGCTDIGDDGAVVVAIGVAIEHGHAGRSDGGHNGFDHFRPAGFGKIGDTFDEGEDIGVKQSDDWDGLNGAIIP